MLVVVVVVVGKFGDGRRNNYVGGGGILKCCYVLPFGFNLYVCSKWLFGLLVCFCIFILKFLWEENKLLTWIVTYSVDCLFLL